MDFSQITTQLALQDVVEWVGLITGLLYVFLAMQEKVSCWWFGIVSSACIAWKSFTDYFLIADGLLQLFYIVIGIVGLWSWISGRRQGMEKPIVMSPWIKHLLAIVICILISWPVSWLLIHYADARYGYPDTLLTLLSVWATLLLVRKDLHNWIYWIVIDFIFIWLYWQSEAYLFAILFFIYAVIAMLGFNKWRNRFRLQSAHE